MVYDNWSWKPVKLNGTSLVVIWDESSVRVCQSKREHSPKSTNLQFWCILGLYSNPQIFSNCLGSSIYILMMVKELLLGWNAHLALDSETFPCLYRVFAWKEISSPVFTYDFATNPLNHVKCGNYGFFLWCVLCVPSLRRPPARQSFACSQECASSSGTRSLKRALWRSRPQKSYQVQTYSPPSWSRQKGELKLACFSIIFDLMFQW